MITEKNNVFYCDCGFFFERGRSGTHNCETGLRKKLAESEAKLSALAAENAGLKAANAEGCKWDGEQWVGISIETPATDSFLAEVRAQAKADGVQEYADSFRHSASKIRECHGDTIRVRALLHESSNADEFAALLRKGMQS
ncbi:hypothetical protein [Enterobacter hormaechei]|uniref:hypothetical protein n=1 Tax=Enterobacter hormaechei TaxID=158836 RepID=UPI001F4AB369|nr:hypothetical protein [Enterobacter hormaechei]MCL8093555.1 hypothetical protein [Enterobacter hormaechei]MCM7333281.1 hypothetical protein [Enterobacter hormaechei]